MLNFLFCNVYDANLKERFLNWIQSCLDILRKAGLIINGIELLIFLYAWNLFLPAIKNN